MTTVASLIDLGEVGGAEEFGAGTRLPSRWRRTFFAAATAVVCLLVVGASAPGRPVLSDPLWTGEVSLNGFTLGSDSIYLSAPGGKVVMSRDVVTGRQRWSMDITDLPDGTMDLGGGVAAVATRQLSADTARSVSGRPDETITFVRESDGARLGQTSGYLDQPSAPGLPVLVFRDRPRTAEGCAELDTACQDVTAWDVSTRTVSVAWRLSLPPGTLARTASSGDGVNGLLEMDGDNSVMRLREIAAGTVVGTAPLSHRDRILGQVLVVDEALVLARRESNEIVLVAYRRPALTPLWSVHVPAPPLVVNSQEMGFTNLTDCGPGVCLDVDGRTNQFVDLATGAVTPPLAVEVLLALGGGALLAATPFDSKASGAFVVDRANRVVAEFHGAATVVWEDRGGRALLSEAGPARTGFIIVDPQGRPRGIGSVTGTNLNCAARGDFLACGNGRGTLRVWRLPV
jgi:hypothetical protein